MATKELTTEEVINSIQLPIIDADEESVFVKIQDWRMRVYFEDRDTNPIPFNGKVMNIEYKGDVTDPFSIVLLPLKIK